MKANRMKEKIARGEAALGCSVMFPSPQIVEMLGIAGFDWVLIDCEHGSIGPADVELMAVACDAVLWATPSHPEQTNRTLRTAKRLQFFRTRSPSTCCRMSILSWKAVTRKKK